MASEVSICNVALSRCGINSSIAALNEDGQEAEICNLHYAEVRDQVLRDAAWPFATRYASLALVEEDPNEDWAFAYRAPTDMLRAIRIIGDVRSERPRVPFKLGSDEAGLLIYTDWADAQLEYTIRITDTSLFSPDFASAVSWRLAMEIATPLTDNPSWSDRAARYYGAAIAMAGSNAANEQAPDPPREAESVEARA